MNNIFTTSDFHGVSVYEVVQSAPNRFYARFATYLPDVQPTPEQLAQMTIEDAEYAAACEHFGHDPDAHTQMAPYGMFTTEWAARRSVELHDAISFSNDDISAFGASGMGLEALAAAPLTRELDELEKKYEVRASGNPYTERGVEDRTLTVARSLGLPAGARPDDHDVMHMLGERQARA